MKTKVILHGGFPNHENEENVLFFKELLKGTPANLHVLLCFFSKELERIPINRDEAVKQFEKNKGDKKIIYEVADEALFPEQVKRADIIFFYGGNTLKLISTLKKFEHLKELFKGKIIAGESAGTYALSSWFHSEKAGGTFEGLGIVPVKTICHYTEERKDFLKDCSNDLEEVVLPDYSYKVFEY